MKPFAGTVAHLLLMVLIGLEAETLRRWTYRAGGGRPSTWSTAVDRAEAEAKAFARWLAPNAQPRPPVARNAVSARPYRSSEPVIGLFPEPERPR